MAYRGQPLVEHACQRHSAAAAVSACSSCGVALCEPCQIFLGPSPRCRDCAGRVQQRRRRLRHVGLAALAASVFAGIVAIRIQHWQHARAYDERLRELYASQTVSPCDETVQLELVRALEAGHNRSGQDSAWQAYTRRCGTGLYRRVTGRQKTPWSTE